MPVFKPIVGSGWVVGHYCRCGSGWRVGDSALILYQWHKDLADTPISKVAAADCSRRIQFIELKRIALSGKPSYSLIVCMPSDHIVMQQAT